LKRFDEQVRRFLEEHPDGTVVGLAEGLETQAWRVDNGRMLFDVIPRWASRMTQRGFQKTKAYRLPPMPWGLNADELATIRSFHPNILQVREVGIGRGRGLFFRYLVPVLKWLPVLRNKRPSFVLLSFGPRVHTGYDETGLRSE